MTIRVWYVSVVLVLLFLACSKNRINGDKVRFPMGEPFDKLSDYCLFQKPLKEFIPMDGVLPYDLNSTLFTDYATKKRFVYVPSGEQIEIPEDSTARLEFPVGSILVKNFMYTLTDGSESIKETRLLLHQDSGWVAEVYQWNAEQTEANRLIAGHVETISFVTDGVTKSTNYLIPTKNQCKNCHADGYSVIPIGPRLGNMNKDYFYADGGANQIEKWVEAGFLESTAHENLSKWVDYNDTNADLNLRARAYLDINCAHCHGFSGAANNSGLDLGYYNQDSFSLGIYKSPVAAGSGSGGLTYDILPGSAEESILWYRMESDIVDIRMPELGRNLVDERGLQLIADWINSME